MAEVVTEAEVEAEAEAEAEAAMTDAHLPTASMRGLAAALAAKAAPSRSN